MKHVLITFISLLLLLTLVSASQDSLGVFERNNCIELIQTCSSCTYNNITSIKLPNSTLIRGNRLERNGNMSQDGVLFNLTFCEANDTGTYSVQGHGDIDGSDEVWVYDFSVTDNGRVEEDGIVIVVYSLLFFIILGWWFWTLKDNMYDIYERELGIKQSLYSGFAFLAIVLYRYFCEFYFANEMVMEILLSFMEISAFTHILLPILGLFISILGWYRRLKIYGKEEN